MYVLIEPSLVVPLPTHARISAADTVRALVDHHALVRAGVATPLIGLTVFEALADAGLYPLREAYEAALAGDETSIENSPFDVARMALYLLQSALAAGADVGDFLVADTGCVLGEAFLPACDCHPILVDLLIDTLTVACALLAVDDLQFVGSVAASRTAGGSIEARCRFSLVERPDGSCESDVESSLVLPVCCSTAEILAAVNPVELMRRGLLRGDLSDIALAIRVAVDQASPGGEALAWELHPQFVHDLGTAEIVNNQPILRKILRACVEVLTETNLGASHHLRVGSGPEEKQIRIGDAAGWRQDVDREWHIHFWRMGDGTVQLASARGHQYVGIPAPVVDRGRVLRDPLG